MTEYQNAYQSNVEAGRAYPHEFLSTVAMTVEITLQDWLKNHGIPPEVISLVGQLSKLREIYTTVALGQPLRDFDAHDLHVEMPFILNAIVELGGVFYDEGGSTRPRTPITDRPAPEDHPA